MRRLLLILSIGLILVSCNQKNKNGTIKQSEISDGKESMERVSFLIDSLYTEDQQIQTDINKASQNGENEKVTALISEEMELFARHIPILKGIYKEIGYPTIDLVGKENSNKFLILVQHSDADVAFQEEMLEEIKVEMKKGNVSAKNYAYLTDRVNLAQDKPQVYGTQLDYNTSIAQVFPKNLSDSVNVNKRRHEIGMEPIEIYLNEAAIMHFRLNKRHYDNLGITKPRLYAIE